ncbi:MAG: hypothetical protein ACYTFG_11210 [Planctomycetota bacterium]|jgi:hypothetical protein
MMRTPLLIGLILAFSAGCSSYETLDLDKGHRAGHFVRSKEQAGLLIAAESYFESRKSEMFFWFDLGGHDYIPVVLYFDNLSENGFVLTGRDISLFLRDGTKLEIVPALDVVDDVRYGFVTSIFYFPFFVFVGPIWSMVHRAETNFDLEVDYRRKDLFQGRPSIRVPGRSDLLGAVFFRLADGGDVDLKGAIVQITLTREKGADDSASAKMNFQVPLE